MSHGKKTAQAYPSTSGVRGSRPPATRGGVAFGVAPRDGWHLQLFGIVLHLLGVRVRLKYILPLLPMALSVGLLRSSYAWFRAMRHVADMPGPGPAFNLLVCINAPVAAARAFCFRHLPDDWDDAILVVASGLFWYWIALNLPSWREPRMVVMFRWWPLRVVGDLLLIAIEVALLLIGPSLIVEAFRGFLAPDRLAWRWAIPSAARPLVWSLTLIFFFGRDFI